MSNNIIHVTGVASLAIQVITSIIDTYILAIHTHPKNKDIKSLLFVENCVNYIEMFFYIWMVYSFSTIKNITRYRYYDWSITTPTMLFSYSMYLLIRQKEERNEPHDLWTLVNAEKYVLAVIFVLNWLMLYFGYQGEMGKMKTTVSTALGFIPFILMFYIIYEKYAKHTTLGSITFVFFVGVWAMYGVAALMSYKVKNVMYNILDLFAKNFFGLFLAYMVVFR